MSLRSGLAAQFGWGEESTWGTAVVPDHFLPMLKESLEASKARLDSDSIYAGRRVRDSEQWSPGIIEAGGDVELELWTTGMGELWKHALGGSATSGSGPYVHTFTPGDLDGKGLTLQVGKPDRGGTVRPWNLPGSKVKSWELEIPARGEAKTKFSFSSKDLDKDGTPALGTFTPPAGLARYTWAHVTVGTIHGVSPKIRSIKITGTNGIEDDRYFLGASTVEEQDETDLREYGGEAEVEFANEDLFDAFWDGDEADVAVTLARGADSFALTGNARLDGSAPVVEGRGKLTQKIPFTFLGDGSDSDALTIVVTNTESAL